MMLIVIYQGAKKKELNNSVLLIEDKLVKKNPNQPILTIILPKLFPSPIRFNALMTSVNSKD